NIQTPLSRLFPDLQLNNLGKPLEDGTFRFTKGTSTGFAYKNLSGGEKAVFDLILDFVIAKRTYDNTIFCIDEPESHMNTRLQAELLSVLYDLIPENCQLMLATHSIGMMRRARDIEVENPGSVVFLDFGDRDFDQLQVIEPTKPDRKFWKNAYDVALDDLATLVTPERVVICEGEPKNRNSGTNYSHDARCYECIFGTEFPETQFVPGGNASEVAEDKRGIAYALGLLTRGIEIMKLIDRDDRSDQQVADLSENKIRVLSRRNLESYLFEDEVLEILATSVCKKDKVEELLRKKQSILANRPYDPPDDLKPASGEIYNACKNILHLTQCGNDAKTFMRDTLAPLIKPEMSVYKVLKRDIFAPRADS
ncbi:MAG: ATP-binding protein, partial [Gammaproteobacteria bacterium]|nr:ATP-binding protein [Gammaproteobacteria bacterium]